MPVPRTYTQKQLADGRTEPEQLFGDEARAALLRGFNALVDLAAVTLGPRGRNVAITKSTNPRAAPELLNDGGLIARRVFGLATRAESMGLLMARQLAWRVEELAGDGTTTALLVARQIVRDGYRLIAAGHDPMQLKRELDLQLPPLLAALRAQANPFDSPKLVHALAQSITRDDALAKLIVECIETVTAHGAIEVRPAQSVLHDREYIAGSMWNKGWESSAFVTSGGEAVLTGPHILFCTEQLRDAGPLVPLLEKIAADANARKRGLVVVAMNIEGEALNVLAANKARGVFPALALHVPGVGEPRSDILQDLATLCGGRVFATEAGDAIERATLDDLGRADEVRATRSSFSIMGGKGRPALVRARVAVLRKQAAEAVPGPDQDMLYERAGKLLGGVALLRVGGASDTEREFLMGRCEEAVRVIRAASADGVVPGGGVALLRAAQALHDAHSPMARVVRDALARPARQIAQNAGCTDDELAQVLDPPKGLLFDVLARTHVPDDRIVDPLHVLNGALRCAFSVAGMAITTEAVVHMPRANRSEDVQLGP